jgi:hypothetical protein
VRIYMVRWEKDQSVCLNLYYSREHLICVIGNNRFEDAKEEWISLVVEFMLVVANNGSIVGRSKPATIKFLQFSYLKLFTLSNYDYTVSLLSRSDRNWGWQNIVVIVGFISELNRYHLSILFFLVIKEEGVLACPT